MRILNPIFKVITGICAFTLLLLMVVVIIRFTHFPDLNASEESCDRPCHELEWARICRLQFVLESHAVAYKNCNEVSQQCYKNEIKFNYGNTLLTVNQQIPGPVIHVCIHDILVVDVINRIPEKSVSIHWRGQLHKNSPLMDGVPLITQCPITSYSTFQYKFRASYSGTHMWHLYNNENSNEISNNIYGMLIVRESKRIDTHKDIFDYDKSDHVLILKTVKNIFNSAILINGQFSIAKDNYYETPINFNLEKNKNYRFRIAHAGGEINCPITGFIDHHQLLIITLDGNSIEPIRTNNFTIVSGERLDLILNTSQAAAKHYFKFTFSENCEDKSTSFISLNYMEEKSSQKYQKTVNTNFNEFPSTLSFTTTFEHNCGETATCLENIKSRTKISERIINEEVDVSLYLFYGYHTMQFGNLKGKFKIAEINNISFIYPPSPLASQISDVPLELICNENSKPSQCITKNLQTCYCTHMINIEVGKTVELLLIHREVNGKRDHIFHLHGHKFYVLGRRKGYNFKSLEDVKKADKDKTLLKRNLKNPVMKDTLLVPQNGVAVIRFIADNPGYWILKEEGKDVQGMKVVFHVVGSPLDVPETFPRCGNWVGPKFFLE